MKTGTSFQGIRIVFVFEGAELGGAERQGLLLAVELREKYGADVAVLSLLSGQTGRIPRICSEVGIPWSGCPFGWRAALRERADHLWAITKILRKLRPQVVLPYTWIPNVCCGLIWRFTGARLCIWNQRDEGIGLDGSRWQRLALKLTPLLVANSNASRQGLIKNLPAAAGRVNVVHSAVRLGTSQTSPAERRHCYGLADGQLAACMVANLHRCKDHATLLQAWKYLCIEMPTPPMLLLAGRGGYDNTEHSLAGLIQELDLAHSVRLLGSVDDVPGLLSIADGYVHSAVTEGMPNAVLEAMAAGLPVVATDLPGIREAVGDFGVPFLAPVGDARGMAQRLMKILADPQLRDTVGNAMRERAATEFSVEGMVDQMAKVIGEGLHKRLSLR